jgi:hypothetical protein
MGSCRLHRDPLYIAFKGAKKNMNYDKAVTQYIENAPLSQQPLLMRLRTLIHETVPDVSEAIKWGFPVFAKRKDFAYLRVSKKHITLGFYNFDRIENAEGLLEGDGNTMRHIKIRKDSDIEPENLVEWLTVIAN